MGNESIRGPLCGLNVHQCVADGTLVVRASPVPGLSGLNHAALLSTNDKIIEALKRVPSRLPGEAGRQFSALLEPQALAIMAGVLAAWGASHFFGVGEIVDAILLVAGGIMLGGQLLDAADELTSFVGRATNARTSADLDAAAGHMAAFVSIVGVNVLVAVVMHKTVRAVRSGGAGTSSGAASAGAARAAVGESAQPFWRSMTPLDRDPGGGSGTVMAAKLRGVILDDFQQEFTSRYRGTSSRTSSSGRGVKAKEIRQSHTSGADLFKPMYRRVLSVDSEIVVYERVGGPPGTYATYANQDARLLGADIQGRVRVTYVVTAPLEVLETTAADMPLGRASGVGGRGGAQQIHLPPDWGRYVRRR